jgi:hypothetical protein
VGVALYPASFRALAGPLVRRTRNGGAAHGFGRAPGGRWRGTRAQAARRTDTCGARLFVAYHSSAA